MKIILLAISLLLFSSNTSAQHPDPYFYLDSNFVVTTNADYHYIRIIKDFYTKQKTYTVTEFYRTGEPYSIGSLADDKSRKIGEFTYYYKNGHPKINRHYNGEPTGIYQEWYEDGRVKLEGMYLPMNADSTIIDKLQIRNYWDKNNVHQVIDGNGFYSVDLGDVKLSGKLKNGLRDSIWNGSIQSLKATFKETYDQGKLISGISTTYGDVQHEYSKIQQEALPIGGKSAFLAFLKKNLKIKNKSTHNYVSFDIDENGHITNIRFARQTNSKDMDEVIRVLKMATPWVPKQIRGIGITTTFNVPFIFNNKYYGRPYERDPFGALNNNTNMPQKIYYRPADAIRGW